ncbi:EI24 domain-containing protein, partial [Sphingomonas sp. SRS2]|uniref:EI24 domain-containing protein n=1 Tax=Sphingomonas sp. SRS2 TaxID=133190 RepID=UPI00061846E8
NLVALPFYVLLLVTGIGPLILFVLVNGAAFGRDLGEMVAARHGDRASRRAWLAGSRGGRMLIGSMVTALFLVPFANLIAPVLGVAMTTHFYMRTRPALPPG